MASHSARYPTADTPARKEALRKSLESLKKVIEIKKKELGQTEQIKEHATWMKNAHTECLRQLRAIKVPKK